MPIEGLRYALIISLVMVITRIGFDAFAEAQPQADYPFPDTSLCIHHSGR